MAYDFSITQSAVSTLLSILVTTIFIYFAARFVLDRASFIAALLTALLATFLAELVAGVMESLTDSQLVGIITAVAVWALVAAIFFRARWVQGAIIGLVAWVLWAIVYWLIRTFL